MIMQTHTISWKKAGGLRVAITIALLSTSLPLVTACNPFSKSTTTTTTTTTTPACQTNNTATVYFQNQATTTSYDVNWDGSKIVFNLAPGATSSTFTVSAGVDHSLTFMRAGTTNAACNTSYPNIAQCAAWHYWCTYN